MFILEHSNVCLTDTVFKNNFTFLTIEHNWWHSNSEMTAYLLEDDVQSQAFVR